MEIVLTKFTGSDVINIVGLLLGNGYSVNLKDESEHSSPRMIITIHPKEEL